jgi:hypothetical protein
MKYYGWLYSMEDDRTRYIFNEHSNEYVPLVQCENVNDMYIIDILSLSFHNSFKLCESVGLQMIKEFDFQKIPGTTGLKIKAC